MFRIVLLFLCVLIFLPVAAHCEPDMAIADSKISLEEPVMEGKDAKAEFVVFNKGDSELVIKSVFSLPAFIEVRD